MPIGCLIDLKETYWSIRFSKVLSCLAVVILLCLLPLSVKYLTGISDADIAEDRVVVDLLRASRDGTEIYFERRVSKNDYLRRTIARY